MTELEKEVAAYGSVVKTCEKLQREISAFIDARRELLAAGGDTQDTIPAAVINSIDRFLARINAEPEPSHKQRRITELQNNIERASRVLAQMRASQANDPAAQKHKADVQEWLLRDETELKNLQREG